MFTFIHLSRRTETRRVEYFPFLCTFIPSLLQSASSPLAGISSCEWRKEEKNWDVRTRKYSLSIIFCESKMLQMRNDKSEAPWKLSRYKETLFTRYTESFSRGEEDFLLKLKSPSFCETRMSWGSGSGSISFDASPSSPKEPFCFEERSSASRFPNPATLINRVVAMNE